MEYAQNWLIQLSISISLFLLGYFVRTLFFYFDAYRLKKFFGKSIKNGKFKVVYGVLTKKNPSDTKLYPFIKRTSDGNSYTVRGTATMLSEGTIRSCSYIIHELSKYKKTLFSICSDEEAYGDLDNSFISLGGPIRNMLSDLILKDDRNTFVKYSGFTRGNKKRWQIELFNLNEKLAYHRTDEREIGIILKIINSRFDEQKMIVCAGLGSWGASGSARYLAQNWKTLYKEYKSDEFAIVLEVKKLSDTSAKVLHSINLSKVNRS